MSSCPPFLYLCLCALFFVANGRPSEALSPKRLPANLSRRIRNARGQSVATVLEGCPEAQRFREWLDEAPAGGPGPAPKRPKLT